MADLRKDEARSTSAYSILQLKGNRLTQVNMVRVENSWLKTEGGE